MSDNTTIKLPWGTPGLNLYVRIRRGSDGYYYYTPTPDFQAWNAANVADYDIPLVDADANGFYAAEMPSVAAGVYDLLMFERAGATPAVSDVQYGASEIEWDGVKFVRVSGVQASVDLIKAKTDAIIIGGSIILQSGVNRSGEMSLVQGDDYLDADGNALTFNIPGWTQPAPASASLAFQTVADYDADGTTVALGPIAHFSIVLTGTTLTIKFQLTSTDTGGLEVSPPHDPYSYRHHVRLTSSTGGKITKYLGATTVGKGIVV